MAVSDWSAFLEQTDRRMGDLRSGMPGVAKGFHEIAKAAIGPWPIDIEMMACTTSEPVVSPNVM